MWKIKKKINEMDFVFLLWMYIRTFGRIKRLESKYFYAHNFFFVKTHKCERILSLSLIVFSFIKMSLTTKLVLLPPGIISLCHLGVISE